MPDTGYPPFKDPVSRAVEAEARVAELEARLEDAEGIIENALTGVENLPDYGNQDAAGYLVNDWQPFARIWLAERRENA